MTERDDTQPTPDPSSLDGVVARKREQPPEIHVAARVGHAHGVWAILVRERARQVALAGTSRGAGLRAACGRCG